MILNQETREKLTAISLTEIGPNHIKLGVPNQDAIAFQIDEDDFVIAVSDGVGTCKKAEQGSEAAVRIIESFLLRIKEGELAFEGQLLVKVLIEEWQNSLDGDLSDYCATVKTVLKIGKKALILSLGDGFAAITSEGMKVISPCDETSFTNETKCLGEKVVAGDFWTRMFDIDINTSYVVVVCTDGVANAIKQGDELTFVEEIEKEIKSVHLENELSDFMNDISQYSFDDKTLGVVKYER